MPNDRLSILAGLLLLASTPGAPASDAAEDLRGAPAQVEIQGIVASLSASLWVNAAPTRPLRPGPASINGIVAVAASHGSLAGKGIRIDHIWLLDGARVWEATDPEEQDAVDPAFVDARGIPRNRPDAATFRVALRNGPRWESARVDVVVRVVDPAGKARLLRAASQPIQRVQ